MIQYRNNVYIENGSSIKPTWTDRIAVSYVFNGMRTFTPHLALTNVFLPTIEESDTFGRADFPDQTIPVVPVVNCKYYWEVYNSSRELVIDVEPFSFLYFPQGNDYYGVRWEKTAGGVVMIDVFKGFDFCNHVYEYNSDTGVNRAVNGSLIQAGLNDTYWDGINAGQGVYFVRGTQNAVSVLPTESVDVAGIETVSMLFDCLMFTRPYNEARFYFPTIGAYVLNDKSGDPTYLSYDSLTCDETIRKSDIISISKIMPPATFVPGTIPEVGRYKIEIRTDKFIFYVQMGTVDNKPTWTNTEEGLELAYQEINSWTI